MPIDIRVDFCYAGTGGIDECVAGSEIPTFLVEVNHGKKRIKLIMVLSLLVVIVLTGCASATPMASPTPVASPSLILSATPTTITEIGRDKAIELAFFECSIGHMKLVGEPQNIRTQLITLAEADQLTRTEGETTNYGRPMDMKVWMVQMDGELQVEGFPIASGTEGGQIVTPTPSPPFWGTCTAVLEAVSGDLIFVRGRDTTAVPDNGQRIKQERSSNE